VKHWLWVRRDRIRNTISDWRPRGRRIRELELTVDALEGEICNLRTRLGLPPDIPLPWTEALTPACSHQPLHALPGGKR
jgi:hypothetical protein